jgi:hypothetical protein
MDDVELPIHRRLLTEKKEERTAILDISKVGLSTNG